jgi:P4 family phage/plasmid primase-like protien
MTTLEAAVAYHARGWVPIPLLPRNKRPAKDAWPELRPTSAELLGLFAGQANVGIHLGPSGVVDIDLDCPEAVTLAPALLPATALRFGRDGSPGSHWLYRSPGAEYEKLLFLKETLLEVRAGDGKQTVLPPSIHPTGERVRWEVGVDPAASPTEVQAFVLSASARRLAAGCLLLRAGWPVAKVVEVLGKPTAPKDLINGDAGNKIREWCGWAPLPANAPGRGRTPAPNDDAKTEFKEAAAAYLRDNPVEYSSRNGNCPVCDGKGCFKASNDRTRWTCWHPGHQVVGILGKAGDHWSGDALDLDAHAAGMSVPDFLRDRGYLKAPLPKTPRPRAAPPHEEPKAETPPEHAVLAQQGIDALKKALDLVERAQNDTDRHNAIAQAIVEPRVDALHLGFAFLLREPEVASLLSKIEGAIGKPGPVRRLEASIRSARVRAKAAVEGGAQDAKDEGDNDASDKVLDRGDEVEVSRRAVVDYLGKHVVFDLGELHVYDEKSGAWLSYERHHVVQVVTRYAGANIYAGPDEVRALKMSNGFANGAASLIESTSRKREFFERRSVGCGFRNGFLRADGTWLDKSPDLRVLETEVLPFDYQPIEHFDEIPTAAPRWSQFLADLFALDEDTVEKSRVVMQFIGATMLGTATRHEKALLLWGPKAGNGKSTLMNIVRSLFAPKARCSVPPHLMGERFENVPLATARLNLVSDMPDAEIIDAGNLKAIVSGDEVQFNPKNQPPFQAAPRAGHIMALNTLPHVRDRSRGFWRRMLVVSFNRQFDNSPDRDPDMARKVLEEREAIAAACLRCALDIKSTGYDDPPSSRAIVAGWERSVNNVREFASMFEAVTASASGTRGATLYDAYRLFCEAEGVKNARGRTKFFEELRGADWAQGTDANKTWLMRPVEGSEADDLVTKVQQVAARKPRY